MASHPPAFWKHRGLAALTLLPLGGLFAAVAWLRRQLYRHGVLELERSDVPVIVIGNIAVGGSGKTPVVAWLVARLRAAGYRPGVVSRGYGAAQTGVAEVGPDAAPAQFGDEPVLLARLCGCPVFIGADRPAAARALRAAHPECDVLISDDGMQHYRLGRDIEIAVVDEAVLGNRLPLPAGPLRETTGRLAAVDLVIAHGTLSPGLRRVIGSVPVVPMWLAGEEFVALDGSGRRGAAGDFAGRPVHAVAGIGRPERFFRQLEDLGLEVHRHPFPDHHPFSREDLAFAPGEAKILTAKDGVKCAPFATPEMWVFPVQAVIGAQAEHLILEKLQHGPPTA
jgi:tetraacyldisaccharide 4'-kinase